MGTNRSGNFTNGKERTQYKDRTGQIRKMNCGLKAEIIKYNTAKNIDIKFENGLITNTTYYRFKKGVTRLPMIYTVINDSVECENPNQNIIFNIDLNDLDYVKKVGYWYLCKQGYIFSKKINMHLHRYLLNANKGDFVDHKDHNPKNNKKSNIRICTPGENSRNRKKPVTNTSGYKGVSLHKKTKKWLAQIVYKKTHHFLGLFNSPKLAHKAYCKVAKELHGEFANYG